MLSKLAADDNAVKTIFDHFRNVGIAGLVLAAAVWIFTNAGTGWVAYFNFASGGALGFLGLFLIALNERHGRKKFLALGVPWYIEVPARLVYGLSLIALFVAPAARS